MRIFSIRLTPRRILATLLLSALAVGAMLGLRQDSAHGFPIPPVTYSIIAVSGTHHTSILNLPVGVVGTYEAPIPVDVNGDLLPDVLVSVNLVNVNGVFNNPPNLNAIIAPNIQIDRIATAPVLGQPSPPLKIEVQLSVADSSGGAPTVLDFGYNTGVGGSIPTYYHALVDGLTNFFNPLQAVVDTTGTVVGLQPNINGLGLAPVAAPYQGPLHVIGDISTGSFNANLDFAFRPFPNTVTVGYSTDSAGQHITYADKYTGETDLSAGIQLTSGTSTTNLNARIDRLPQNIAIDMANGGPANSGSIDFRSTPNPGVLPDVGMSLSTSSSTPGVRPLNALMNIDALPAVLHADWSLPPGGPASAHFCAPAAASSSPCTAPQGAGIGSIQAQVTNYAPGGSTIVPYIPTQEQFLNFQEVGPDPTNQDMLITARVERIRQLEFTQSTTGIDATAQLGDGELPLLAHFLIDGRAPASSPGGATTGPYTDGTATISPLPSSAHINLSIPPADSGPTVLTYNVSTPVDITGSFDSFAAGGGGTCGTAGAICGSLQAFHIPSQVVATITQTGGPASTTTTTSGPTATTPTTTPAPLCAPASSTPTTTTPTTTPTGPPTPPSQLQINIDSTPGNVVNDPPDFIVDADLGQCDASTPIVAHAQLLGLPSNVTILAQEGENGTLDDAEFHACDWDDTASPPACVPGQTEGQVGDLSFDVHDWLTRPAGLPIAIPTTPAYADVVAQGVPTAGDPTVNFEATGDLQDMSELDYSNTGGVAGVRVHAGTGGAFSAHLDAENIQTSPTADRISALADVTVPALPTQFDVCFRQPNRPIVGTGASYTVPCEDANPFSDANPLTTSPLTFAYEANATFNVLTSAKVVDEGADSLVSGYDNSINDDHTLQGSLDISNLPKNLTTNLIMPPAGVALTTPLTSGSSSGGSLAVEPLTYAVATNDTLIVEGGSGGATQTYVATGPAAVGATSIPVAPQNANANYPITATVNDQSLGGMRALFCSGSQLPVAGSSCPTAASGDPQVNVAFSAAITDGDLICKDPRTPLAGQQALCASATLENLPSHALLTYDPNQPSNNFSVTTSGDKPMSLIGDQPCPWGSTSPVGTPITAGSPQCFELSSVSLDTSTTPPQPKILIADGNISDIPKSVTGTLFFPSGGSPNVDVNATPALGHVDLVVHNFIAPNPILQSVPDRTTGFGPPTQEVSFFQRGSAFEAEAHIGDVNGFGFSTVSDASGVPLDTQVIRAQFGANQTIRAYADIEPNDSDRMIGDVTLDNVPAGLTICLRGKDTHGSDTPGPGQGTFCDDGDSNIPVNAGDGAFQFFGTPAAGSPTTGLGVDAFVRQATGGNSSILSGHIHITGIPNVLEGTFPSSSSQGDLDIGGFDQCGISGSPACGSGQSTGTLVPAGIQQIAADLASFDLSTAEAGWTGTVPYKAIPDDNAPFPVTVPSDGNQYLEAALHDNAFQVQAGIGPDSQLQRVEMLQQACAAPSNNPKDYPAFPATLNGTTINYKCIEGNFIQTTPTAPIDLGFLDQTPDGNEIAFNGGLTNLPSHMQMTLSNTGDQTDSSLTPCGPANSTDSSLTSNCVPPLVRFDQPSTAQLFGTLQYGSLANLGLLRAVQPLENSVNVDTAPDPEAATDPWAGWAPNGQNQSTDGIRAKIGILGGNLAAIVGIQIHVPQSLTIAQPLGWSQSDSSSVQDYWQASDTKIHVAVDDSNGNPVGSIGQAAIQLNDFDDGYQILAGNPCTSIPLGNRDSDPGNCPDFDYGFHLPGEFGISMYRRDNTGQGKDFMQIDGRANDGTLPLNIGVRLLAAGEQAAIGRLEAQIDNIPTTDNDSDTNPNDPTFRLEEEMVGNGSSPPLGGSSAPPQGEQTQSVCSSAFFCSEVDVKIASVFATFNFQPSPAPPARLVQAVIDQQGSTKQGMEIAGFQNIDPPTSSDPNVPAPITASGFVDINPLDIYLEAGIPLIAGLNFELQSELQASFDASDTTDFYLRENLLHLETASADQNDDNPPSAVGPLNIFIYLLHAEADLLFVPLLTLDFLPPSVGPPDDTPGDGIGIPPSPPGPAQLSFVDCTDAGSATLAAFTGPSELPDNTIGVPANNPSETSYPISTDLSNPTNLAIWPFNELAEPRFILGGLLGPTFDILNQFAAPFFCLTGAGDSDIPLIGPASNTNTGSKDDFPSDPVGGLSTTGVMGGTLVSAVHPVPGATVDSQITPATPAPTPPVNQPSVPENDVTISSPVSLCGEHYFGQLDIKATLSVATTPDTSSNYQQSGIDCPAADVGTLTLDTPNSTITIFPGGAIDGSAVVNSLQPEILPNNDTGPTAVATGNGGGTHITAGGLGSTIGSAGGNSFGDTTIYDPTTESGTAGGTLAGGAAGGKGGASISILANTLIIDSTAGISANGASGVAGTATCSGSDTPGGGGGSGGGISIDATTVTNNGILEANGGNGGSSGDLPGGGGGAGIIKVIAPLQTGVPSASSSTAGTGVTQTGGGAAGVIPTPGAGSCAASALDGGAAGFSGAVDPEITSATLPVLGADGLPKFWNQENTNPATPTEPDLPATLSVPYTAAAAAGSTNYMQTYLCANYISTANYETAITANSKASLQSLLPMGSVPPSDNLGPNIPPQVFSDPCGGNPAGFGVLGTTTLAEQSFKSSNVNPTFTVGTYQDGSTDINDAFTGPELPDGYYGLYTIVAVPNDPQKSCSDPSNDCTFQRMPAASEQLIAIDNGPTQVGFTVTGPAGGLPGQNLNNVVSEFETSSPNVTLDITAVGNTEESKLAQVLCSNDGVKFSVCSNGTYDWTLSPGDGNKTVYVEAVNGAGQVSETQVSGIVDTTAPTVTATVSGGTNHNGFYQSPPSITLNASDGGTGLASVEAFAYRIDDGTEGPTGSVCPGPSPQPITAYPLLVNPAPASCTIPQSVINSLSDGTHTLYFTGIDAVGNRLGPDDDMGNPLPSAAKLANATLSGTTITAQNQFFTQGMVGSFVTDSTTTSAIPANTSIVSVSADGLSATVNNAMVSENHSETVAISNVPMQSVTFTIDHIAPQSALLSVPAAPDGANGWFATRPWIDISAIDQVGGSGLVPSVGDNPVAGISYYEDGVLHPAPAAPAPPLPAFQLPNGQHTVCWFAEDRAGNFDVAGPGNTTPTAAELAAANQCQTFMVDDQVPTTAISLAPTSTGSNGWLTSQVPVTVTASEAQPGSGLALVDASQLCGPPTVPPSGASGICVSIDHAAFEPYLGTFTLPEGMHDVRAFSIDAAGTQSPVIDQPVNIDLSPPVASAVIDPYDTNANGWWHSAAFPGDQADSPPQVVLRAVDGAQGSGVTTIEYQINPTPTSTWLAYTGPFNVPEGINTVNYRAIDAAGLIEKTQTLSMPVDVTPPVVTATSASPAIWLQLLSLLGNILGLSPANDQLQWTVSDNLSPHVHITVLVFNAAGAVVRQLNGGTYNTKPGVTLSGSTPWDGHDYTLTGLVPVGLYYYRVVATDDAGNVAQSGESAPLTIKIGL